MEHIFITYNQINFFTSCLQLSRKKKKQWKLPLQVIVIHVLPERTSKYIYAIFLFSGGKQYSKTKDIVTDKHWKIPQHWKELFRTLFLIPDRTKRDHRTGRNNFQRPLVSLKPNMHEKFIMVMIMSVRAKQSPFCPQCGKRRYENTVNFTTLQNQNKKRSQYSLLPDLRSRCIILKGASLCR